MGDEIDTQFVQTLREEVGDGLRSVTTYSRDDYELLYLRDDVADQYTNAEIEAAIDELRLQTIEQAHINDIFQARHGELECVIQCFAEAIELNFALDDGVGVAVAIDADHYLDHSSLVSRIRTVLETHADPA